VNENYKRAGFVIPLPSYRGKKRYLKGVVSVGPMDASRRPYIDVLFWFLRGRPKNSSWVRFYDPGQLADFLSSFDEAIRDARDRLRNSIFQANVAWESKQSDKARQGALRRSRARSSRRTAAGRGGVTLSVQDNHDMGDKCDS